ncbi:hypothetical protein LWI28_015156 [Acer negundo]|uniref:glutathione transferase n=1 Tax=Acer negundo TaxID=4023 RepID=A0AAD5JR76_ACENE|nr:hypothetical protein LWI28_015156 [Acer negundo]
MRVRIVLAEKGIKYGSKEEDLFDKSPLLLEMKVPVLIHDGKSICESLIIVEYIDEIFSIGRKLWAGKGEDHEAAKKEFIKYLKTMAGELRDKHFFGGRRIGFVDVALVPITSWFYTYETLGDFSIEAESLEFICLV